MLILAYQKKEEMYRVNHIALIFLILLKVAVKVMVHMKTRPYSHHKDPPFDTKHQLMSADLLPVVKLTLSNRVGFQYYFYQFCLQIRLFENHYEKT